MSSLFHTMGSCSETTKVGVGNGPGWAGLGQPINKLGRAGLNTFPNGLGWVMGHMNSARP